VRVDFVVSREDADRMLARVRGEGLQMFYAILPAEFGAVGGNAP
jgi:hypothetical protein